jgi:hypothetical protein
MRGLGQLALILVPPLAGLCLLCGHLVQQRLCGALCRLILSIDWMFLIDQLLLSA